MNNSRGQILPLGLAIILMTVMFWVTLIKTGKLIKDRIQLQIAADTAAQSACAIRARGLGIIGRMNAWLGTPVLGIGWPQAAWWPDAAPLQQKFMTLVKTLQGGYNQAYGGAVAWTLAQRVARQQGADDIVIPELLNSLRLQRNHGPIWYLSTQHIWVSGVPVPVPYLPQIMDDTAETTRWYEQGPDFHRKRLRVYARRKADPEIYTVAAARVYNLRGPMFPRPDASGAFSAGMAALKAYNEADPRWRAQLVPVGGIFEH